MCYDDDEPTEARKFAVGDRVVVSEREYAEGEGAAIITSFFGYSDMWDDEDTMEWDYWFRYEDTGEIDWAGESDLSPMPAKFQQGDPVEIVGTTAGNPLGQGQVVNTYESRNGHERYLVWIEGASFTPWVVYAKDMELLVPNLIEEPVSQKFKAGDRVTGTCVIDGEIVTGKIISAVIASIWGGDWNVEDDDEGLHPVEESTMSHLNTVRPVWIQKQNESGDWYNHESFKSLDEAEASLYARIQNDTGETRHYRLMDGDTVVVRLTRW